MLLADLLKVTLDVNIILSGLMSKKKGHNQSPSYMILKQLESKLFVPMTNRDIFAEYRKKTEEFITEGKIDGADVNHFMDVIQKQGVVDRTLVKPIIYIPSDPSDNSYFRSSNCLEADYLVSGNTKHFQPVKDDLKRLGLKLQIVTPKEFLERNKKVAAQIPLVKSNDPKDELQEEIDAIELEILELTDTINNLEDDNESKRILGSGRVNQKQFEAMTAVRRKPLADKKEKLLLKRQFLLDKQD